MRDSPQRPTPIIDLDLPWDLTDPVRGEVRLTNLRQATDANREPGRAMELASQIARARSLQGRLAEAEVLLDTVERQLGSIAETAPRLRALLERGRILVLRKTPVEAGSRFWEAWLLATVRAQTFFAIDAAQMMSVIETPKKQQEWTTRALELAEEAKDARTRAWCGHLHLELGWHFEDRAMWPRAFECFERAAACFREEAASRNESIAGCASARAMRRMGRHEEALRILHEVRLALQSIGLMNGVVFEELGECLTALHQPAEAERFFARAHELLAADEWLSDNQPARIKRLRTLGKVKS
jgi:tetratricopeptide (TPR) repeat protein